MEELSKDKETATVLYFRDDPLKIEAVYLLKGHGALEDTESTGGYRITVSGYDFYHELKSPRVYWAKKNWFPVMVLALTALAVIVNVIVELID